MWYQGNGIKCACPVHTLRMREVKKRAKERIEPGLHALRVIVFLTVLTLFRGWFMLKQSSCLNFSLRVSRQARNQKHNCERRLNGQYVEIFGVKIEGWVKNTWIQYQYMFSRGRNTAKVMSPSYLSVLWSVWPKQDLNAVPSTLHDSIALAKIFWITLDWRG